MMYIQFHLYRRHYELLKPKKVKTVASDIPAV